MNVRRRYIPIAAGWAALVAVLLVASTVLLWHRLPDPVASHWGPAGAPDGSMPRWAMALLVVALWALPAGVVLARMIRGDLLARRRTRGWAGAVLGGGAVFVLGLHALTLSANLDRADWRDAAPIGPQLLVVLPLTVLAAWGGWALTGPGPDEAAEPARRPRLARAPLPTERAVWVSSASAPWAVAAGAGLLVLAVALATVIPVDGGYRLYPAALLGVAALAGLTLSAVRAQVDRRGLTIALGPLRRPARRIPLDRIEGAWVETRRPSDVGGWGYRMLPRGNTIMLRGGECLVVRYVSGRELAVSVDDAERGAALLNTLIARHAGERS